MSSMPRYKNGKGIKKHFDFIVADFLILQLSYFLASVWYNVFFGQIWDFIYREQSLILFVCVLLTLTFELPYRNIMKRDRWQELSALFKHVISMLLVDIVLMFIMHDTYLFSRLTFVATWFIYFVLEYTFRILWKRKIRRKIFKSTTSKRQIIVFTNSSRAEACISNLDINVLRDFDVSALFVEDYKEEMKGTSISGIKVMGGEKEMIDYAVHDWVDEVILDVTDNKKSDELNGIFAQMGIPVHCVVALMNPQMYSNSNSASYIEQIGNYVVVTYKTREIAPFQIFLKRCLDIFGGIIGSIFAVLVIIIVGPMIKHKSPGPIIFAQERVGQNGRTFKMYKIRSMYMDAEKRKAELMAQNKMDGFMFKMDDDPRIIGSEKKDKNGKPKGIGNFIRKTSLDEFPQFFNVLKGDMSLVGTRPPTLDEWEQYSVAHRKRLSSRPGITGLWQISGRSDITDFDKIVALDSEYIDTWTVGMDIRILLKTVVKVFKHEGAE